MAPIIDIETRWNSIFFMIERQQKNKIVNEILINNHKQDLANLYLTEIEWEQIDVSFYTAYFY